MQTGNDETARRSFLNQRLNTAQILNPNNQSARKSPARGVTGKSSRQHHVAQQRDDRSSIYPNMARGRYKGESLR